MIGCREDETEVEGNGNENGDLETVTANAPVNDSITIHVYVPPPFKQRRLEIPARTMRKNAQKECQEKLEKALTDIEKLINSKRRTFARKVSDTPNTRNLWT